MSVAEEHFSVHVRTESGNGPTLRPSSLLPPTLPALCLHLWLPLHPSSIHPSIHARLGYLPPRRSRQAPPLDKSVLSLCAIPSVVPLEAVLTVMMPGWAPRGSPRLTSETQTLERSPVQLSALARDSAEWIYSGRRKVCHREAPREDSYDGQ